MTSELDDLRDLPEPSRSKAKALLTCRLCCQYLTDPRVLPCRHSFCRKCLQSLYDSLQASAQPATLRVGSMPCPTCQQPTGVPMTGVRGFPVDTKISRIKDLVINEMAKNISKKMNSKSAEASKKGKSAANDDGCSTRSAEDDDPIKDRNETKHRRDHSYDNISFSDRIGTGSNYRRNPAYPDFSKFARYFDHDGKPLGPTPFKPTIRADRHRLGYSSSFQHQRRRVNIKARAFDDSADLFCEQSSRYGSAPHFESDGIRTSSSDDIRDRTSSTAYQRSRSARPTTHRRYHSPERLSEEDSDSEFISSDQSSVRGRERKSGLEADNTVPASRRRKAAADVDETLDYSAASQGTTDSCRTSPKPRRGLRAEGRMKSERSSRTHPGMTLPVHRENIVTDTSNVPRHFATKPGEASGNSSTTTDGSSDSQSYNKDKESRKTFSSQNVRFKDEKTPGTGRKLPKTPTERGKPSFDAGKDSEFVHSPGEKHKGFSDKQRFSKQESSKNYATEDQYHHLKQPHASRSASEHSHRLDSEDMHFNAAQDKSTFPDGSSSTRQRPRTSHSSSRLGSRGNRSEEFEERRKKYFESEADFMTPPTYEDGTPWGTGKTREQIRQEARRSFSMRIKEQFKEYMQQSNSNKKTATSSSQPGEQSSTPDVDKEKNLSVISVRDESVLVPCNDDASGSGPSKNSQDVTRDAKSNLMNKGEKQVASKEIIQEQEKLGRNWEELISRTRAKYSSERIAKQNFVIPQPLCTDGVCHKWGVTKTDFGIPTSIAITSKGSVIVAEYGQNCVEFYDETGKLSHKMAGLKPFSVAVNDKDQVIVGDRKSRAVRFFDEFGGDVAHWDQTTFNWICGISALPSGQLAIYDRERCKIGVYSTPGEKVTEFSSFGSSEAQICMADFIAVDSKNRILIADSGNHCIKAFDARTGSLIGKFGERGKCNGCLDWPKGICIDANDNVIVTDVYNSRVCMFSPSGNFVNHLITGIENPFSVCYSPATRCLGLTRYSLDGASQYDVYAM